MNDYLFREISPKELTDNFFVAFDDEWALLAAGDKKKANMMTIGWATAGILWKRPVIAVFVRPHRYTYGFMEKAPRFSVAFLEKRYRSALNFCGSTSGKDRDKIRESGLTLLHDNDVPYFAESRLVFLCRTIYRHDITPMNFLDPTIEENYPAKDYHRMYVGQIEKVLVKRDDQPSPQKN